MPHIGTDLAQVDIKKIHNLSLCCMCSEGGDLKIGEAELEKDGKSLEMWCTCPVCGSVFLYVFKLDRVERHLD